MFSITEKKRSYIKITKSGLANMQKIEQLYKAKRVNLKKMSQIEYKLYVDFIRELSNGMCQANCGRVGSDVHHSFYGSGGRDDRFITIACRECHNMIHHGTKTTDSLKLLFKTIGKSNWRQYHQQIQ